MFFVSTLTHLARKYRAAQVRRMTERQLHSLPLDVQKDIGWPPVDFDQPGRIH